MKREKTGKKVFRGGYLFALTVVLLYGILYFIDRDKTVLALGAASKILSYILFPLIAVFVLMVLLNLFFKSSQVTRLLGEGSGFRGVMLSAAAGIISMGPVYAWYPLLKEIRERGAGNTAIAVFLGNRAVKPFLLPVMISYFGCVYVLLLTFFMFIASVVIGYLTDALCKAAIAGDP